MATELLKTNCFSPFFYMIIQYMKIEKKKTYTQSRTGRPRKFSRNAPMGQNYFLGACAWANFLISARCHNGAMPNRWHLAPLCHHEGLKFGVTAFGSKTNWGEAKKLACAQL